MTFPEEDVLMEAICESALVLFIGTLITRVVSWLYDRHRELSVPILHLRLFALSVLVTIPFAATFFLSLDWEISYLCSPLLFMLVLAWVPCGQILALIFRLRRQVDPNTGKLDPLAVVPITANNVVDEAYQALTTRYGKRQADQILALTGGLLFLLLVCLVVIFSVR
jgi:hypothetical protein